MTNYTSFIDAAITDIACGSTKYAEFASMVQKQKYSSPIERIGIMLLRVRRDIKEAEASGNEYSGVRPGGMLQFVQRVQNKCCWSARRIVQSMAADAEEDVINGINFSEEFMEDIGIDPCNPEHIRDLLDADYAELSALHFWLSGQMGDFGASVDPLSYYIQKQYDAELNEWVVQYESANFDDTMSVLDDIAAELRDNSEKVDFQSAQSQLAALASKRSKSKAA
jgi:hypothetical protein